MLHGTGHQSGRDSNFILPLTLSLLFVSLLRTKISSSLFEIP